MITQFEEGLSISYYCKKLVESPLVNPDWWEALFGLFY